jgi:hypothetical protein
MSNFAFSKANHNLECGGKIKNSAITTTSIDMNGQPITSVASPVNLTDAANKAYVDAKTSSVITTVTVTLSGTSYTLIAADLKGDFHISVKNQITDGPSATFFLTKSESTRYPSYTRLTSSPGSVSFERLNTRWDPGQGIELKKTGNNYNGTYTIRMIQNT